MSEIKGQLLGILLVLMIFATVSVAAAGIFNSLTTTVQTEVTEIASEIAAD